MGGVGAFSALREQTGGASLRRGASKVAHRIRKERRLCLTFRLWILFDVGFWEALIRIRRLVRVMDGNEGQIFLLKLGGTALLRPM